ncbi:MAG: tRNA (guanosine(46)-N7)-methyltransferase TrmB [Rhodospirillales bacterium]|nr:tRNA (guanosine(46)-N7)-methyltransferase TrmB [Alphaproteobacteria bacterium]MBL6948398.1 tRNA (guanosine(46)-N7)-methyltransferase TrmB [Rhodospirillales bacterium]
MSAAKNKTEKNRGVSGRDGPQWYGRRRGHKLRPNRQALIDTLLPELRVELPETGKLDLRSLFPEPVRDVWLEVGFGGGEHLAAQALAYPEIGFIGCEPFINGTANLLSLIDRDGLTNVRLFDDDARKLFPVLPDASLGRLYALYTDPWPKTRHHRRRFICGETVDVLVRLLKDGAELRLAHDHMGYVGWMLEHLTRCEDLQWRARSKQDWTAPPTDWVETRYEKKAKEKGLKPAYLCFVRGSRNGNE